MEESKPARQCNLSDPDVKEFQKIWRKEFKQKLPLEDARAQARRLLELYALLYSPTLTEMEQGISCDSTLTDLQERALSFIEYTLSNEQHSPSVREIARAIGCKSSRTAFRVVNDLTERRWLKRRKDGTLDIRRKHV